MKLILAFDTKNRDIRYDQKPGEKILLWPRPESRYIYAYVKNTDPGDGFIGSCKVLSNEYLYFEERNHYEARIGSICRGFMMVHVEIVDHLFTQRSIFDKIIDFLT
jgi:hypothetical protein